MSGVLRPRPGFNPMQIGWGGPDEPISLTCSYCDEVMPENHVPLMMFNNDGWCARFCPACMEQWWGMKPLAQFPEGEDDDDWEVPRVPPET